MPQKRKRGGFMPQHRPLKIKCEIKEEITEEDASEEEEILLEEEDVLKVTSTKALTIDGLSPDEFPNWVKDDLGLLMENIHKVIPQTDSLKYGSRVEKLDWDKIAVGNHSGEECKKAWLAIQCRLRRYRILSELVEDAKQWLLRPWTHFYRGTKRNRHPDMPRRPLSTYMLFYLEHKDAVAQLHPKMDMTQVSKIIADQYKVLTMKKKDKYIRMAAEMRKDYEIQMKRFYQVHPDLQPIKAGEGGSSNARRSVAAVEGPSKPHTPFMHFFLERLNKLEGEGRETGRGMVMDVCKTQWKAMQEKKKCRWIQKSIEDDQRFQDELKVYQGDHPTFVPKPFKPVISKEEKAIRDRVSGKPVKPPNSAYALFSRLMLCSDELKTINCRERLHRISDLWRSMEQPQKKEYEIKMQAMLDQYKLEYASYLESLPPQEREEELSRSRPKPRAEAKPRSESTAVKNKNKAKGVLTAFNKANRITRNNKKEARQPPSPPPSPDPSPTLYKDEPSPPPSTAFNLFINTFMKDAKHMPPTERSKEAPRYWQMLPDAEKATYRQKHAELRQKYIHQYRKFLQGLSQEDLAEYTSMRGRRTQEDMCEDMTSIIRRKDLDKSTDEDSDAQADSSERGGSDSSSSDSESSENSVEESASEDEENSDSE